MPTVLVIDDDRSVRHLVSYAFGDGDIEVVMAGTASEGLDLLRQHHPDVALLDIMLPEISGLDLFKQIHEIDPKLPVIFVTMLDSSDTTIQAMQLGAFDYLPKPLSVPRVQELVAQALEIRRLMNVPVRLPGAGKPEPQADLLVGRSHAMQDVYKAIGRVASQNVTVVIRGESGTGKELVARAIYQHSARSDKPFLAVNCAAIPDSLLESELFGHEKGSFTGAVQRRIGKFEQCSEGTLFLDEVGDMSPVVQSKVLRVLQGQDFERVGGSEVIRTHVRIIAATNRDLEKMVTEGKFRADLYYRLSGFTIALPPLRERPDDLLLLLETILTRYSREMNKDVQGVAPDCMDLLLQYPWPGNVRELENVLKQSLLQAAGPVLISEFLPAHLRAYANAQNKATAADGSDSNWQSFVEQRLAADSSNLYDEALSMMERYLVTRVLRQTNGNQSQAARILGITRGNLRNKIRALELRLDHFVEVQNERAKPVEPVLP
jgi:two-component system nitrogen regulation response regulator GlnG